LYGKNFGSDRKIVAGIRLGEEKKRKYIFDIQKN